MVDLLVRSVPESDAARIAAGAARLGISQSAYLRRILHEAVSREAAAFEQLAGAASGLFPEGTLEVLDSEWDE